MDGTRCASCDTKLSATAKFCSECGTPLARAAQSAEYKRVTVLFADVVHSMDIAALVGAERLREIMAELVDCACPAASQLRATGAQAPAAALPLICTICRSPKTALPSTSRAVDALSVMPTDPGFVLHEVWLWRLRALLAHACGDGGRVLPMPRPLRHDGNIAGFRGAYAVGRGNAMTARLVRR